MANIVVFGGSGFIGRQAVYAARSRGHHVAIVDIRRLSTSTELSGLTLATEVSYIQRSPENLEDAKLAIKEAKLCFAKKGLEARVDAAINYIALFKYGLDDKTLVWPNVATAHHIAEVCRKEDIFMVHTGAVAAHGNKNPCPLKEHYPLDAFEAYGRSKARSEHVVFAHVQNGLRAITFRPGGVYGSEGTGAMIHAMFETAKTSPVLPCTTTLNSYVSTIDIGRAAIHAIENQHLFYGPKRAIVVPKTLSDIAFNIADNLPMEDGNVLRHLRSRIQKRFQVALPLPRWSMYLAALSPKLPWQVAQLGQVDHYQSNEKFDAVFLRNGFERTFATTTEGLDQTLRWLYAHHWKEELPAALPPYQSTHHMEAAHKIKPGDTITITYQTSPLSCAAFLEPVQRKYIKGRYHPLNDTKFSLEEAFVPSLAGPVLFRLSDLQPRFVGPLHINHVANVSDAPL